MSDLMKTSLRELSQDLNLIQTKKKELIRKYELESKSKILNEIILIRDRSKKTINKIDREYEILSEKHRNEYIGAIRSNKTEFEKMMKDVEKIDTQLKKEKLIDKSIEAEHEMENDSDKFNYLSGKISKQNNNLNKASQMGKEITSTQNKTLEELVRQRNKLKHTNNIVTEVEQTLSLHDQLVGVMGNRELFNKLKLVGIVALLFIADVIVLFIKLR